MIFLLAGMIVFFFLVVGAIAFVVTLAFPSGRKYALSTALWFAAWGPSCVLMMVLVTAGLISGHLILQGQFDNWISAPTVFRPLGAVTLILCALGTCIAASALAWLHQALIHRCTYALFRLYATLVTAGIGSVFGWFFVWLMAAWKPFIMSGLVSMLAIPLFMLLFGTLGFKHAHALRGQAPSRFTWITPEEFAGRPNS